MRNHLTALTLLAAACSPAPSGAPQDATTSAGSTPAPINADVAALSGAPAAGQWFERVDEGVFAAGFGAPQSEYQFAITCNAPSGALTIMSANELAPGSATTLRLITAVQTLELPARSESEGLSSITAEIAAAALEKTPLISMLGAPTDRFAVDAGGAISVYPWHESIARTLIACR